MKNAVQIRKEGLDKFYTIPEYAKKCIDIVLKKYNEVKWELIIEPSAGNGSFFVQLPKEYQTIGIDISPEITTSKQNIIKGNFFDFVPKNKKSPILVIGNPPFGKNSSLAVKFFNHASQWADVIAFIIPRTFRKTSIQNNLNLEFHLVYDEDTPVKPCHFSPSMSVKCCFQIWEKKIGTFRQKIYLETKHRDWGFLAFGPLDEKGQPTPPKDADFSLRAYGGKIGEIITEDLSSLRPKSWHWIKCNIDKNLLISRFQMLDYSNSTNTARQNSMGRGELVKLYIDHFH